MLILPKSYANNMHMLYKYNKLILVSGHLASPEVGYLSVLGLPLVNPAMDPTFNPTPTF